MGKSKKIVMVLLGLLISGGILGAQTQDLKNFLEDYLKVTQNFATAMEKAATSAAVKKAVGDFSAGMKPLVLKAEALERKYRNWGPAMLEGTTGWEREWAAKFEQMGTRLSNAMMKVYQLGMEDPTILEALEKMGEDLEKVWPGEED